MERAAFLEPHARTDRIASVRCRRELRRDPVVTGGLSCRLASAIGASAAMKITATGGVRSWCVLPHADPRAQRMSRSGTAIALQTAFIVSRLDGDVKSECSRPPCEARLLRAREPPCDRGVAVLLRVRVHRPIRPAPGWGVVVDSQTARSSGSGGARGKSFREPHTSRVRNVLGVGRPVSRSTCRIPSSGRSAEPSRRGCGRRTAGAPCRSAAGR
jgi:hypothetical protein